MKASLKRRVIAEFTGSLFLLSAVVGSGITGEHLAGGNIAIALLANTIAPGAALVALILAFGPISGAHLNPAVTLADAWQDGISWRETPAYIAAQTAGAFTGVATAHLMFGLPIYSVSKHAKEWSCADIQRVHRYLRADGSDMGMRAQSARCCAVCRRRSHYGCVLVHCIYLLCNPAVTLARSVTNTFSGIRPADTPAFVAAELAGALVQRLCSAGLCLPLDLNRVRLL